MSVTAIASITEFEGSVIRVVFNPVKLTPLNLKEGFLNTLQALLDRKSPFVLFVDTTHLQKVPITVCVDIVKFMKLNRAQCRETLIASAIVVSSDFIAGLLQNVFKLSPPVSPNTVVAGVEEAWAFLQTRHSFATPL